MEKDISGPAIRLSSLGLRFFLNVEKGIDLRREGIRVFRALMTRTRKSEFWALRDIDLEIPKGEIFGIIGGNGAGKSTLLKLIAGIFPPTRGTIAVDGTIAPLIELGAAFNPDLTGAENIFLTGSIYRIPRRIIKENFERIVEFSGLRRFIDTPVKNYSSGMFIRLAFSTIIFFRPEIVLIDEVFSVGDEVFQQKSFEKILSFQERGATIVLVSHDLNLIGRICRRALVLSRGRTAFLGPAEEAIDRYHDLLRRGEGLDAGSEERSSRRADESGPAPLVDSRRWGNRRVEIRKVSFVDRDGRPAAAFAPGDYFEARIHYLSKLPSGERPIFGAAIHTAYKMLIYGPNTLEGGPPEDRILPASGIVRFIIPSLPLFRGDYLFSASAYDPSLSQAYDHLDMMFQFRVLDGPTREFGCVRIQSRWDFEGD